MLCTTQRSSTFENESREASTLDQAIDYEENELNLAPEDSMNEAEKENLSIVSDIRIFFTFLSSEIGAIGIKMILQIFSHQTKKHMREQQADDG